MSSAFEFREFGVKEARVMSEGCLMRVGFRGFWGFRMGSRDRYGEMYGLELVHLVWYK